MHSYRNLQLYEIFKDRYQSTLLFLQTFTPKLIWLFIIFITISLLILLLYSLWVLTPVLECSFHWIGLQSPFFSLGLFSVFKPILIVQCSPVPPVSFLGSLGLFQGPSLLLVSQLLPCSVFFYFLIFLYFHSLVWCNHEVHELTNSFLLVDYEMVWSPDSD